MGLQFVVGPSGSGKTFHLLSSICDLLQDNAKKGTNVVLCVPDQATYQTERSILSQKGIKGFMNLYILSFRRLSGKILSEVGGISYPFISKTGKSMAVQACLWKRKKDLTVFSHLVDSPGFRKTLSQCLSEIRAYDLSPSDIASSIRASLEGQSLAASDLLWQKIHDLSLVYEEYKSFLQGHFFDPDDYLDMAATKVAQSRFVKEAVFFIDGFSGFTPQEYKLIKGILKTAKETTMTLCMDEEEMRKPASEISVFSPSREVYDRVLKLAREVGARVEEPYVLKGKPRFEKAPLLGRVEEAFRHFTLGFGPSKHRDEKRDPVSEPALKGSDEPSVEILALANPREEVEFCAREILRLARDKGLRYRDITVEVRDLSRYGEIISLVFDDYGIPFFLDQKRSLSHHPLAELIRSSLDMVKRNMDFESCMRYLKTDLLPISRDLADKLENYALAHGVRGAMWLDEKPWRFTRKLLLPEDEYDSGKDEDIPEELKRDIEKIDGARKKAFSAFSEFYRFCAYEKKGGLTAKGISQALLNLISQLGVPKILEDWRKNAEQSQDVNSVLEHSRVLEQVTEMLEEAKEILGDQPVEFSTYAALVEAGLEDFQIGVIPPTLDQVLVAGLDRSRQPECKVTFLLGAQEGVFPKKQEEDAVLTDRDRERLKALGIDLEPSSRVRQFQENYLVYVALTRPSEKLYITHPLGDQEGKALAPSYVINLLRTQFPEIPYKIVPPEISDEVDEAQDYIVPSRVLGYLGKKLSRLKKGFEPGALWREVYRYLVSRPEKCKLAPILSSISFSNKVNSLGKDLSRRLYGAPLHMSVSKLERYASCPFSYFAGMGLGLKEREVLRLDPKGLGTFFHEAMREFIAGLVSGEESKENVNKMLIPRPSEVEQLRKVLTAFELRKMKEKMDEVVERLIGHGSTDVLSTSERLRYIPLALKRILERAITVLYETFSRGQFVPISLEAPFSFKVDKDVYVRGIIDRIDVMWKDGKLYFYILDYKSSPRTIDLTDAFYGLSLQLLVYILASMRAFKKINGEHRCSSDEGNQPIEIAPVGGLYFTVRDPFVREDSPIEEKDAKALGLKKLRMGGVLVKDTGILRSLDGISETYSDIYPLRFTRSGVQDSRSVLTQEEFTTLLEFSAEKLKECSREILSGRIDIQPYRKGTVRACQYCPYMPLCGFDILIEGNEYMVLTKRHKNDILEEMRRKIGGGEHE